MQVFKKYASAADYTKVNGGLIIQVGNLYIVGDINSLTEINIIENHNFVAQATIRSMLKLGNINKYSLFLNTYK